MREPTVRASVLKHAVVRNPIYAALLALMVFVLGVSAIVAVPLEEAPEVQIGVMVVSVVYPGAGPEDIERDVTRPLEDELRSVRNVEWFNSRAQEGVSLTTLRFLDGADMDLARRDVKRAVDLARSELPDDAEEPYVIEVAFDDLPIVYVALSGSDDPVVLRKKAEELRQEIESVPGISEVEVFGGAEREVRVRVDFAKMTVLGLDLRQVAAALRTQGRSAPAGAVDVGSERTFLVRTTGAYRDLDDVGEVTLVAGDGGRVKLREVASISLSPERRTSAARTDARDTVTLLVRKEKGASTIPAADGAKKKAEAFAEKEGLQVKSFLEQKRYIKRILRTLGTNAFGGMILVVLVLAYFLGLRLGMLIAVAIPVSLVSAVIGLWFLGLSLSGVAIFGLVLVLGMVVDGAIVVGEVIDRRWRDGEAPPLASDNALSEVGRPIVSSALTTMAAFVPMIFMPGISGQFMSVLPIVVSVALCGALLADHILLPAAFSFISTPEPAQREDHKQSRVIEGYVAILASCLRHKFGVVVACGSFVVLTMLAIASGFLGFEFFPRADTGIFWVDVRMPPGTKLDSTLATAEQVEARVGDVAEVESRVLTVGDSGRLSPDATGAGDGGIGPEWARLNVELLGPMEREVTQPEIIDALRKHFAGVPGAKFSVTPRPEGPPQGAPVAIRVQGDDFDLLRTVSKRVEQILIDLEGTRDVTTDLVEGRPEYRVRMKRSKAAEEYGLTSIDVSQALQLAVFGADVADFLTGDDALEVRLMVGDGRSLSLAELKQIPMRTPNNQVIPVAELADIEVVGGFQRIIRRDFKRTVTVRSELDANTSSDQVRNHVKKTLESQGIPRGVSLDYAGDNVERDRSFGALLTIYPIALVLIFVILVVQFSSFVQPLCVVAVIPLSFLGAILGLAFVGLKFGFMSGVGLVALAGIVVNDAIVMVDAINAFRAMGEDVFEASLSAGRQRFRAVWLTTLTTFGGLSPFALAMTDGAEFWQPLAVTICAGLLATTALILLVLPAFYCIITPLSERFWTRIKTGFDFGRGYAKE